MSTMDRLTDGYEPDFDIDLEFGKQGEIFVTNIIDAFREQSVEVKNDAVAASSGRIYIEYECKRRGGWHKSGIATTSASVFAVLIGPVLLVAPTDSVREVARARWKQDFRECNRGSHPTRGVAIPIATYINLLAQHGPTFTKTAALA